VLRVFLVLDLLTGFLWVMMDDGRIPTLYRVWRCAWSRENEGIAARSGLSRSSSFRELTIS